MVDRLAHVPLRFFEPVTVPSTVLVWTWMWTCTLSSVVRLRTRPEYAQMPPPHPYSIEPLLTCRLADPAVTSTLGSRALPPLSNSTGE